MTPNQSTFTLNFPSLGQRLAPWREILLAEPMPLWLRIAGGAIILVMLVSFYSVVNAAAQHARQQHHTEAVQADARSYCRTMADARDRDSCAAQLGVALADDGAP